MNIGIIGMGKMGSALADGLGKNSLVVADRNRKNYSKLLKCDALLLCVKPRDVLALAEEVKREMDEKGRHPLVISIAAGVPISALERRMPGEKVMRAMPNMAVRFHETLTPIAAGKCVKESDVKKTKRIFDSLGGSVVVKERHLDAVTAISGSGPAYFFWFSGQLEEAGVKMGLERRLAHELAKRTLVGSAAIVKESEVGFDKLIADIATPGGTTEAALKSLHGRRVHLHMRHAVGKAKKRAAQVGKRLA